MCSAWRACSLRVPPPGADHVVPPGTRHIQGLGSGSDRGRCLRRLHSLARFHSHPLDDLVADRMADDVEPVSGELVDYGDEVSRRFFNGVGVGKVEVWPVTTQIDEGNRGRSTPRLGSAG